MRRGRREIFRRSRKGRSPLHRPTVQSRSNGSITGLVVPAEGAISAKEDTFESHHETARLVESLAAAAAAAGLVSSSPRPGPAGRDIQRGQV